MWQKYFDNIYCINIPRRTDRREYCEQLFWKYDIDVTFFDAIEHEQGHLGLIYSMKTIFKESLEKGYERILIFEDDVQFLEQPESFDYYMNKCAEQLKTIYWDLFYLGCQQSQKFINKRTDNLLTTLHSYSTHAVAYGKFAMDYIIDQHIDEPIDNWLVREFQPKGTSFCAYPLLASQIEGYSDIGKDRINWDLYISSQYQKFVRHLLSNR